MKDTIERFHFFYLASTRLKAQKCGILLEVTESQEEDEEEECSCMCTDIDGVQRRRDKNRFFTERGGAAGQTLRSFFFF